VDLATEQKLAEVLVAGSRDGMLSSAHDLSEGGLAVALVESCLQGHRGARVVFDDGADAFVELFSESAGRALVSVPRSEELRFSDMCEARGLPWRRLGVVGAEDGELEIQNVLSVSLDELRTAYEGTLPRIFAGAQVTHN
jgi:phosphoribosylformylglycinamidine synthase